MNSWNKMNRVKLALLILIFTISVEPGSAFLFKNDDKKEDIKTLDLISKQNAEIVDKDLLIKRNSLIDTPYKLAAHYVPIILLRALTNSDYPKNIRKAHFERLTYTSCEEKTGKCSGLIEKMTIDIELEKTGLLSRRAIAKGKINDLDFEYSNDMKFRFTKRGTQIIRSTIEGMPYINLDIDTDGNEKTNDVEGSLLGKKVKYHTKYRTTAGSIGGYPYKIYVSGIRDKQTFQISLDGSIGQYKITGHGEEVKKDYYEITEKYGPLTMKSTVKVFD